ncbi:hypothetical protein [Rubritalea tangerina]|uniref:Peptidase C39-like domain-containing protein n=1 Tax=Rubritalea tangerina TaxID=430798 RepID=A0ABW4Z7G6_9BACT
MSKKKQQSNKSRSPSYRAVLVTFFLLCSAATLATCLWLFQDEWRLTSIYAKSKKEAPNPELYSVLKKDIQSRQAQLARRYTNAQSESEKQAIIDESRSLILSAAPLMMRCWLGTPWDYNGTSETPGQGQIACGYFVNTIMRDLGFNLPRIKLSQQASQIILGAYVPKEAMTIRSGMGYQAFCQLILSRPAGIYIVGLDKHVGFIVHDGSKLHFIHSSGRPPWCVVDEKQNDAPALEASTYRVFGNVTAQDATLEKWLTKSAIYP